MNIVACDGLKFTYWRSFRPLERKSLSSKPMCGYVKPEMKIVELKARASLLLGRSGDGHGHILGSFVD